MIPTRLNSKVSGLFLACFLFVTTNSAWASATSLQLVRTQLDKLPPAGDTPANASQSAITTATKKAATANQTLAGDILSSVLAARADRTNLAPPLLSAVLNGIGGNAAKLAIAS